MIWLGFYLLIGLLIGVAFMFFSTQESKDNLENYRDMYGQVKIDMMFYLMFMLFWIPILIFFLQINYKSY